MGSFYETIGLIDKIATILSLFNDFVSERNFLTSLFEAFEVRDRRNDVSRYLLVAFKELQSLNLNMLFYTYEKGIIHLYIFAFLDRRNTVDISRVLWNHTRKRSDKYINLFFFEKDKTIIHLYL